jgi:hypothetical protein
MFLFFSHGLEIAGSILVSVVLTVVPLKACGM